jgi:hypothetical protein
MEDGSRARIERLELEELLQRTHCARLGSLYCHISNSAARFTNKNPITNLHPGPAPYLFLDATAVAILWHVKSDLLGVLEEKTLRHGGQGAVFDEVACWRFSSVSSY